MNSIKTSLVFFCAGLCISMPLSAQDTIAGQPATEQFRQRYHFFSGHAVTQPLTGTRDYKRLEAGFRTTGGDYRQAQDAPRQKDIIFVTEGMQRVGKYLVSGSFAYTHTLQDSVAHTLRFGLDDPQPYYFFAYKKGNWQVGQYRLQGAISRSFVNDKLTAALAVNYHSINGWRSNDPRPEQFSYNMHTEGALLYKVLPRHTIGLSGSIFRKSLETSVQYRNKDYQLSLAYPEYVTRIQYGYGFEDRSAGSPLENNTTGYGWNAVYKGGFSFGDITLKGGYTNLTSKIKGVASALLPDGRYGFFYEDIWQAAAYWEHGHQANRWSVLASYTNHLGRDVNQFLRANNYVYSFEQLSVQPLFLHTKNNRPQYELGIDARLRDLFRADGTAGTLADYQQLQLGASAAWYAHGTSHGMLKTRIAGGYKQAVDPLFNRPAQESVFIHSVIFHDYYYFAVDSWHINLDLQYSIPVRKINAFIRLQGGYEKATIPVAAIPATVVPGTDRWNWQAGLGIFL